MLHYQLVYVGEQLINTQHFVCDPQLQESTQAYAISLKQLKPADHTNRMVMGLIYHFSYPTELPRVG